MQGTTVGGSQAASSTPSRPSLPKFLPQSARGVRPTFQFGTPASDVAGSSAPSGATAGGLARNILARIRASNDKAKLPAQATNAWNCWGSWMVGRKLFHGWTQEICFGIGKASNQVIWNTLDVKIETEAQDGSGKYTMYILIYCYLGKLQLACL